MKNLNLSLIALLFSSLLVGCGLKGPLYQETPKPATQEKIVTESGNDTQTITE